MNIVGGTMSVGGGTMIEWSPSGRRIIFCTYLPSGGTMSTIGGTKSSVYGTMSIASGTMSIVSGAMSTVSGTMSPSYREAIQTR